MNCLMIDKCKRATFIDLGTEWVRVDYFEPDEHYVYATNEETGDEYRLEAEDLVDAKFFALCEI